MQVRYYAGVAALALGIAGVILGNEGFGEKTLYIGACVCLAGVALLMSGKRKNKSSMPSARNASGPRRDQRSRRRTKRPRTKNSGDSRTDHDEGDGGDGD